MKDWIAMLEEKNMDLQKMQTMWNNRAEEFSKIGCSGDDFALTFIEQRMSLEGKKVLDVGFGAGRYLVPLAQKKMEIYGVELAENMIRFAIEKLDTAKVSYQKENLHNSSWEDVDIDELGWENKFDLVFLSMSPAISSYEQLEKALRASKEGLYLSAHMYREDSLLREVQQALGVEPDEGYIGKLVPIFNILFEKGYFPDFQFLSSESEQTVEVDRMLQRYIHWIFGANYTAEQEALVREQLQQRAQNNKVTVKTREINGYLFVDKTKFVPK